MDAVIWSLVICVVIFVAGIRGWRCGFVCRVNVVLGVAIASVSAHLFSGEMALSALHPLIPRGEVSAPYVVGFLSAAAVYVAVYVCCVALTRIIAKAMAVISGGVGDALAGALFSIFNGVLLLSIGMNVMLCLNPEGPLLRLCSSGDANAPQTVLLLAPAVIGSPDAADLHHAVQLREARKISV